MQTLGSEAFDAVLVDLLLPDVAGIELIEWIRDRYPAIVILAISGTTIGPKGENMSDQAIAAGASGLVEKPFTASKNAALISIVRNAKAAHLAGVRVGERRRAWKTTIGGSMSCVGALTIATAVLMSKAVHEQPLLVAAVVGISLQGVGAFITGLYAEDKKRP